MTSITDRCRIGQANLEYKSAANDTWKLLLYTTFNSKYNVFGIDVKFGSIKITQKFGAGTGTCIAMLTAAHYKNPKLDMDVEQEMALVDFLLEFDLVGAPACEFSKDLKKKNNGEHISSIIYLSIDFGHDFLSCRQGEARTSDYPTIKKTHLQQS